MPGTRVRKRGKVFRLVDPDGTLSRNAQGTPVDGGGHASRAKAERQSRVVNQGRARAEAKGASRRRK